MITTLKCSLSGVSSAVQSQADDQVSHHLTGSGKDVAGAAVVTSGSSYAEGYLSYVITLSGGIEGQNKTSSTAVSIVHTLVTSANVPAQLRGEITSNPDVETIGGLWPVLTLTVGNKSYLCDARENTSSSPTVVDEEIEGQQFQLTVNVSLQCNPGNEEYAKGGVTFSIALRLIEALTDPTNPIVIPFIDQQYFAPKTLPARQSLAAAAHS